MFSFHSFVVCDAIQLLLGFRAGASERREAPSEVRFHKYHNVKSEFRLEQSGGAEVPLRVSIFEQRFARRSEMERTVRSLCCSFSGCSHDFLYLTIHHLVDHTVEVFTSILRTETAVQPVTSSPATLFPSASVLPEANVVYTVEVRRLG